MIRLTDLLAESDNMLTATQRIESLPRGTIFSDAKNITSIFATSRYAWNQVAAAVDTNAADGRMRSVSIQDIHITQPNIQSSKVEQILRRLPELPAIRVAQFADGSLAIADGHHRLVANWALGNQRVQVMIVPASSQYDWTGIKDKP